jgi:hypothetical protein
MQEAAQWRRSQGEDESLWHAGSLISLPLRDENLMKIFFRFAGISMEGDAELLAATEVKPEPKRDEWMTTLPPERKVRDPQLIENAFELLDSV